MADPLGEEHDSPVPNIVHRYPDRVLFLTTLCCSTYCRYCTRRRVVGEEDRVITEAALKKAVAYIRNHTEIRDVLISGGDPLVMKTEKLEHIVRELRAIPHVDIIRIGTRVPVVLPMRITDELLQMLRKYQPVWINTHFAHPREITEDAAKACAAIVDAGFPLGNQTVLLRGVNDSADILKELFLKLVHMRVRPYYLYQCDLSRGIGHFRTTVDEGIDIMHALTGNISGYAVPKFVIDAPGGGGKIPMNYNYVVSRDDRETVLENFQGETIQVSAKPGVIPGEAMGGKYAGQLVNVIVVAVQSYMAVDDLVMTQIGTQPMLSASPAGFLYSKPRMPWQRY